VTVISPPRVTILSQTVNCFDWLIAQK
jgi:hypothetical protein